MTNIHSENNWRDIIFSSFDGLRIYARHYESIVPSIYNPVLCLPGLTRNSQDFHYIATYLSQHPEFPRNVYCIDFRGRGRSEYDSNWQNYSPFTELNDVLALTTIEGIHKTTIIGTSRGGIVAMLMAAMRPTLIESAILNDIGPIIETEGLLRIRSYAGAIPPPKDWEDAMQIVKSLNKKQFPNLNNEEWLIIAKQLFMEIDGTPIPSYDVDIAKSLSDIDFSEGLPTMWPQFMALSKFPTLVIRGANSDILSQTTLEQMRARAPEMQSVIIEDEGHAPILNSSSIHEHIFNFMSSIH